MFEQNGFTDVDGCSYLRAWLARAWPTLAAFAYGAQLQRGRGVVFIDFANREPSADAFMDFRVQHRYIEGESVALMDEQYMPGVLARAQTYDPATDAVVVFSRKKGGPVGFTGLNLSPTPQQAYEEQSVAVGAPLFAGRIIGIG